MRPPARVAVGTVVRRALLLVALGLVGWFTFRSWSGITAAYDRIGAVRVLTALVLWMASVAAAAEGWRRLLGVTGTAASRARTWPVYGTSNLGKYVPGAVWPVVLQADYARRHGLSPARIVVAFARCLLYGCVGGVLVSLAALPTLLGDRRLALAYLAPALVCAALVTCWPGLVDAALGRVGRMVRRPFDAVPLRRGQVLVSVSWFALGWVLAGVHFFVLAGPLLTDAGPPAAVATVGGFAVGAVVGTVSGVLPGGVGTREVALGLVFAPVLPASAVLPLLLLSRAVSTAGDVLGAAVSAGVLAVRQRRDTRPRPRTDATAADRAADARPARAS